MNYYSIDVTDYYNNKFFTGPNHYIDWLLKLATKAKKNVKSNNFVLICHILFESYALEKEKDQQQYIGLFKCFNERRINTVLLLCPWDSNIDRNNFKGTRIHIINYHAWLVHYLLIKQKQNDLNPKWNHQSKKYLMLTGKPHVANKIRLLWKLSKQNILEDSIWSMLVRPGTWDQCKKLLPELSNKEFKDFVQKYNRQADDVKIKFQTNTLHYFGIPYDVSIYEDTLFRIIADTRFRTTDKPMLSEKIYTTMLNRLPFIMAGDTGSIKWLRQQGFRTFENYLPISNYDDIHDQEQRLDAIVSNCKFWITGMTDKKNIEQDVEYNYNLLCAKIDQTENDMQVLTNEIGIGRLGVKDVCLNGKTLAV